MAVVGWLVHGGMSCFIVVLFGGGGELTYYRVESSNSGGCEVGIGFRAS